MNYWYWFVEFFLQSSLGAKTAQGRKVHNTKYNIPVLYSPNNHMKKMMIHIVYLLISKLCSQNPNSVFIENEYQCSYLTIGQIHYSSLNKVQYQSDLNREHQCD